MNPFCWRRRASVAQRAGKVKPNALTRTDLAPARQVLEEKNLCEALEGLIRKSTAGTTIQPKFTVQGQSRLLPPEWDENLLRIDKKS